MMEAKGVRSGVTVAGSDAPTSHHISPRTENAAACVAGSTPATQVDVEPPATDSKKKRGRPRKHGPDGPVTVALSDKPITAWTPPAVIEFSTQKRPKLKPTNAIIQRHQPKFEAESSGECLSCAVGTNFTPHIITVNSGEDITMKVISFSQQGPHAICILAANGLISNVTLCQPDSSGGTLTYEGRFEILSLTGSFMPSESGGIRNRSGGMSVSFASPDGRVVGGGVAGLLVAASPVQIVVASFLAGNQLEQKPKKQKSDPYTTSSTSTPTAAVPVSSTVGIQDGYGGHGHHTSAGTITFSFHGDSRNSSDDNNDSFHGGS